MFEPTEHESQATVIEWCKLMERHHPALRMIFAIPNGGKRTLAQAAWLKKEGLRPGVPDLFVPWPKPGFMLVTDRISGHTERAVNFGTIGGLFIEMKTSKNPVSPEQSQLMDMLRRAGYRCEVCRSADEAIRLISEYLELKGIAVKKTISEVAKGMKKGALHKDLGVPASKKIPEKKLVAAAKKGGKVGERARFAEVREGKKVTKESPKNRKMK